MKTTTPQIVSLSAIREKFDLSAYDVISNLDKGDVIFFDGDTHIDGHLNLDYTDSIHQEARLVFVNGNLIVAGDIAIRDYRPWLLVTGNVTCDVLYSGDNTTYITGDANVKYAYYGYYNDGSITVEGTTYVPYILNSDHHSDITPEGAVLINLYSDDNDFFEYDYTSEELESKLVKAALDKSGMPDGWKFIEVLKAGKSPFLKNARPAKKENEEEIAKIAEGDTTAITELDLTDKKLKAFPLSLIKLTNLRKLILNDNDIEELPEEISSLTNLEELSLYGCKLKALPSSIGALKQLHTLNISSNFNLRTFPESIVNLTSLKVLKADHVSLELPATFKLPPNLEEISLYGAYRDRSNAADFPEAMLSLQHLKVLDLRDNYFKELPTSLEQVQSLEAFMWTGSNTDSDQFPDFTKFTHLKKLVISRTLLSWKEEVFDIPSLEYLVIDRNSEQKEYFDQITADIWLEMMEEDPAQYGHLKEIIANKKLEADGRFSYILNPGVTPEDIQHINKLPKLKYLDLSFNKLPYLPDTIYELKVLEYIDLRYNSFSEEEQAKIAANLPGVQVIFND